MLPKYYYFPKNAVFSWETQAPTNTVIVRWASRVHTNGISVDSVVFIAAGACDQQTDTQTDHAIAASHAMQYDVA